jgi:hypothetical protein
MVKSNTLSNSPKTSLWSHIASVQASQAAIHSTYAMLSATDFCFLLSHDIMENLKLKHIQVALLLSSALPTQSESINPCICIS